MLFNLNSSNKSSIVSYIQLFHQGVKQFQKSKSSKYENVNNSLGSNISLSVYLPNVLNKTIELNDCQSGEINKRYLTTKNRTYWWM